MIIRQSQLTLHSYFNAKYSYENTNQAAFWELFVFAIWTSFGVFNTIKLYKSIGTKLNEENNENITQKQWWYFFNQCAFFTFFIGFIITAFYVMNINNNFDVLIVSDADKYSASKWVEFIFCLLSIIFCFSSHIFYFIYKKAVSEDKLYAKDVNKKEKSNNLLKTIINVKHGEVLNSDRISEISMFIIFHMILVHVLCNLMYFNFVVNAWVNLAVIVILEVCVVYFSDIDLIGAASILMIVVLYFIQLYKQISIAFTIDERVMDINALSANEINNINALNAKAISDLQDDNGLLQSNLDQQILSNVNLQGDLTGLQGNLASLQSNLTSLTNASNVLRNYQVQSLTNQLNNNLTLLTAHKAYLICLNSIFVSAVTNLASVSPSDSTNSYYDGYIARVGSLINQVDNLIPQFQNAIANVSSLQDLDITTLNQNLSVLLANDDFIRSHVYFDTPTSYQTMDCGNFNLLYSCYFRIFANLFRNNDNVPWNGSNENVVRDTILYIKHNSSVYNGFSTYTKTLVDELYTMIDGDNVWNILGGQLSNDTNSSQMNAAILAGSSYGQIYNANGVEYCNLLFTLASQSDFATYFNSDSQVVNLNWQLPLMILEDMEQYLPSNFGFKNIQNI